MTRSNILGDILHIYYTVFLRAPRGGQPCSRVGQTAMGSTYTWVMLAALVLTARSSVNLLTPNPIELGKELWVNCSLKTIGGIEALDGDLSTIVKAIWLDQFHPWRKIASYHPTHPRFQKRYYDLPKGVSQADIFMEGGNEKGKGTNNAQTFNLAMRVACAEMEHVTNYNCNIDYKDIQASINNSTYSSTGEAHCSTAPGEACTADYCKHGGVCVIVLGHPSCACPWGFDGKQCETVPAPGEACTANYCKHGGVCLIVLGHPSCACPVGYPGKQCETGGIRFAASADGKLQPPALLMSVVLGLCRLIHYM